MFERVQRGLAATITNTIAVDGTATDPAPDSATVEVLRDDGTVLVAAGAATLDTGTGKFSYTLTPVHTALLDVLTVRWTVTIGGHVQVFPTLVEVAGGFLFSIAEARATKPLTDASAYPAANIVAARTEAERQLEDACGVAFVPRYARERFDGAGGFDLMLRPRVRSVRAGTVDGTALTVSELGDLEYAQTGRLRNATAWTSGADIELVYEHGYDYPPAGAGRAALRLAKHFLVDNPVDDRAIRLDVDDGSYVMATPGLRGSRFGIPEVDAFVDAHRMVAIA